MVIVRVYRDVRTKQFPTAPKIFTFFHFLVGLAREVGVNILTLFSSLRLLSIRKIW